jgi:hypothetical protein
MRSPAFKIFGYILMLPVLPFLMKAQTPMVSYGTYETRDYWANNGRKIRITSLGNLVGLESPMGFEHINNGVRAREGYVLAYTDPGGHARVLFDVNDIHSAVLGRRDFVPYSFTGPASGTVFAVTTPVRVIAVVDTADGLFRLTHQFEWQAGLGTVTVTTTITNRTLTPLTLNGYKRHADINLDAAGGYGVAGSSDWVRLTSSSTSGIGAFVSCYCAPQPGPPPLTLATVSTHVLTFTGVLPSYRMIHSDTDNSELYIAGPATSTDLPGVRVHENNQATLVWAGSPLAAGGSRTFTAQYDQR